MASLKSLLKDTAIYGISSIVGRFLNYMLVPIYTHAMSAAQGGYGVITEVYAWVALLLVILTYGMETTFFRFINKETENPRRIYSTVLIMVGSTSVAFLALSLAFLGPIADWMGYGGFGDSCFSFCFMSSMTKSFLQLAFTESTSSCVFR